MYRWVPTHLHCNAGANPVVAYHPTKGGREGGRGINTPNYFNGNWGAGEGV